MPRKNLALLAFAFAFAFGATALPAAAGGCRPSHVLACEAALQACVNGGGEAADCCAEHERCMIQGLCEPVWCQV